MKPTYFDEIAKGLLNLASEVRDNKMVEYNGTEDRLSNFRKAANLLTVSVPIAVQGMMIKHTVSISDMVMNEFSLQNYTHSIDTWTEKFVDQINYLLLLYASVVEARGESKDE